MASVCNEAAIYHTGLDGTAPAASCSMAQIWGHGLCCWSGIIATRRIARYPV